MTQSATSAVELPAPNMEVGSDSPDYLDATFAVCEKLAKTHYENFSVGSRLLPKHLRKHFYSIYAFSRGVDDLGDETHGDRPTLLDLWERELDNCYPPEEPTGTPAHPYFVALAETIRTFDIPAEPFKRLIEANRRDQTITRHETFEDVLEYCSYSANPVGHLVLYLSGIRDLKLHDLSNRTCTGLQLANFWQDVGRDLEIGRIYIPQEDLVQFGVTETQILDRQHDDKFEALMRFQVDRARQLFSEGYALVDHLDKSLKSDFVLFARGGLEILRAIERQNYTVLATRPRISKLCKTRIFTSTWIRAKLGLPLIPNGVFKSAARHTA
ncbi:MAG TPA: squalene synthase HpnC [Dehalococcoidia bacterium]|jgi:squalene synthase HpnC|nr:squalene synthase HpnC [Dehalococcoidia bacterium]MDP7262615.1 squalene synthase HpnC [Dehalococcoidia bacterium]MDP7484646.1 squalene synthase HpnC [Dehalococcoidia bacterium]HJP27517.1 squalene synthase HpnC [Dehalococcoidia bacterium]